MHLMKQKSIMQMKNIINALLGKLVRIKYFKKKKKTVNFSSCSKLFKAPFYCNCSDSTSRTLKYKGNTGRKHILPFQPQFWCMGCQPTWCHWYLVSAKQVGSSSNSSHSVQHPSPSPSALSEKGEWRILPITLSREIQNFFPPRIFHSRLWAAARARPRQCSPINRHAIHSHFWGIQSIPFPLPGTWGHIQGCGISYSSCCKCYNQCLFCQVRST